MNPALAPQTEILNNLPDNILLKPVPQVYF